MVVARCKVSVLNTLLSVGERKLSLVFSSRFVSTCKIVSKSRPSTAGIPAWAKAANKRRAQVLLLEKKKTPAQMQAEVRLADVESNKSDFLTTSRVGVHKPKQKTTETNRIMSSTIGNVFVFYHPKQDYPIQHSKDVNMTEELDGDFAATNSLTDSQVAEIKALQGLDPKLWSADVLSDMFKVDPLVIINMAPLNADQQLQLEVEQDFLATLSEYERKEYTYFKDNERKKQLRKLGKRAEMTE